MDQIEVIGVDTGGTFTDCVGISSSGQAFFAKAESTPADLTEGVLQSVANAARNHGTTLPELLARTGVFLHGATVAVNTWLTRSGPVIGLLTTRGHEDMLLIGLLHQKVTGIGEWETTYAVKLSKAEPIVPRIMTRGLNERVDYRGRVLLPLRDDEVLQAARELVEAGARALVVSLLWGFKNPVHELRIKELLARAFPQLFVTLSSELVPVSGEYERTATAAINAYLAPRTVSYLGRLAGRLREHGFERDVLIMNNQGGSIPVELAARQPILTWASGPAGGVLGARALGKVLGYANIVTTDVGGTSFDVGVVREGEMLTARAPSIGKYHIAVPMIDIASIGAGGGSIARVNPVTGALEVGPQSAGARPGPACYGQGGEWPTVTDADLVLGRIRPGRSLGGSLHLDPERAAAAIKAKVADPLGMGVEAAADAIVEIVDAHMADLVRKVTIERGYDPRDFVLFAFGGSGPLHAGAYARDIGVSTVVVPATASVFSAFGIAMSSIVRWHVRSVLMLAPFAPDELEAVFAELEERARREAAGGDGHPIELLRFAELKYRNQVAQLRVPVPAGGFDAERALNAFDAAYEATFGPNTAYRQAGVELVNCGVISTRAVARPALRPLERNGRGRGDPVKEIRQILFDQRLQRTPVYDAELLPVGHAIEGPAIVDGVGLTVVVHPQQRASVDAYGNVLLHLAAR